MQIAGREISGSMPPYLIAEISGNHGGSLDNALQLIREAKIAGADAVKTQCFQANRLTMNSDSPEFRIKGGPWDGRRLYDLYAETETPRAWFPHLFAQAHEVGITLLSSVFSPEDVDFLESLGCPAYKIASMEITDVGLIEYAYKTGKPLIISTGMVEQADHDDRERGDLNGEYHKGNYYECSAGYGHGGIRIFRSESRPRDFFYFRYFYLRWLRRQWH